ncbi:MAG: cysteine synthase A [Candidatus Omnitrophota bacterium]|jgi:cysteine synthase A|nr:MAG: cysteine synthase A [Candidatus Omnitrophota bacterium]
MHSKENDIYTNILGAIGSTPLVMLNRIIEPGMAQVLAKVESFNPGGSVKDRIAKAMIEDAEEKGLLKPGSVVIEPTSGNTGIGLAMVCAVKGYRCILTMPDTMSLERVYILKAYNAEVVLTPGNEGMDGAIKKAEELYRRLPNAYTPQQFKHLANPKVHRETTAKEILSQTKGKLDAFVAGVGTGGTITGVGEVLKDHNNKIKIVAVEPENSAVLSGRKQGQHKIQGIGAGFVPEILNTKIIDRIITVTDQEAYDATRQLAKKEGIFGGPSSGAALVAALKIAQELGKDKRVITIFPDTGERYFSVTQYFEF